MRCGAVDLAGADGFACVLGGLAAVYAAEAQSGGAESCACIQAETKGSIAGPASKNLVHDRGAAKTRMEGSWRTQWRRPRQTSVKSSTRARDWTKNLQSQQHESRRRRGISSRWFQGQCSIRT